MREVAITTEDNPFDPIQDFDNWYAYDIQEGYNSLSYLARIFKISQDLPDGYNSREYERAIDEICYFNPNYRKIISE